jgi:exopolyphosphatase/guanosine-5'-triphosphate,3'-diphosphate pyrophosphatase
MERYETEPLHVRQVCRLALRLFDLLQFWHRRGEEDRRLLEIAALLHDIGWSQTADGKGHHKWSARLILEYPWVTLPKEEVAVLAQVARYHRKALPSGEHEGFQMLSAANQRRVSELAALLRVGDGLDRTHRQRVQQIHLTIDEASRRWTFRTDASDPIPAELAMAKTKSDLLEMLAGVEVTFPAGDS